MIVDSHVHLKHGNREQTEYTPEQIVESMDAAGVEKSILFAMCTTTADANQRALKAVAKFPDRLIGYAYALPNVKVPIMDDLERSIVAGGLKGIKIHRGECTLGPHVVDPVIDLAGELGVPCLIDFTGRDQDLLRLAKSFPKTSIIVAHIGQYKATNAALLDRFIEIAEGHENVYLDISGVVLMWKIPDAVKRVGAHRVIWGSDGPHPEPNLAEFVRLDLRKVRACGLSADEEEAVFGGNILRLLGLME